MSIEELLKQRSIEDRKNNMPAIDSAIKTFIQVNLWKTPGFLRKHTIEWCLPYLVNYVAYDYKRTFEAELSPLMQQIISKKGEIELKKLKKEIYG